MLVAWDGDLNVEEVFQLRHYAGVEHWTSFSDKSMWRIVDVSYSPERTGWKVLRNGEEWAQFDFPLAGEYNVLNATAAVLAVNYRILMIRLGASGNSRAKSASR